MQKKYTEFNRIILMLCFTAYTCSYLLRTNFSVALPYLMIDFNVDKISGGLIGSAYFWMYAIGQLINGALVEKIPPKIFVVIGLVGSALCNVAVAVTGSYTFVLVLWGANGYFLSMLWCSMVKIMTNWYKGEAYRKASIIISLTHPLGYVMAWGGLGIAAKLFDWRIAFIIPAVITGVFLFIWIFLLEEKPVDKTGSNDNYTMNDAKNVSNIEFLKYCAKVVYVVAGASAIVQGMIKEGISLWLPTILTEISSGGLVPVLSTIIPIIGAAGVLVTGWLLKKIRKSGEVLTLLFALSGVFSLLLIFVNQYLLCAVPLFGLLLAAISGCNIVITSFIPLQFLHINRCAQASGTLNFLVYVGAVMGGVISGWINAAAGWAGLFILWTLCCVFTCISTYKLRGQLNA